MSIDRSTLLVSRLAYLGVSATDVDAWRHFATAVMGVHVDERSGSLRLRLDAKQARIVVDPGEHNGASFYGWEVADGLSLDAVGQRLTAHGVPVQPGAPKECEARGVTGFIWFRDPLGNRVEICRDHRDAPPEEPLRLGRPLGGFKTGRRGLGHVVLMSGDVDVVRRFYTDVIGMRLSDYTERPFDAHFFHVNERHHSFAIIRNAREGLHHLMLELLEFDDVGQTYDLLEVEGVRLGATLGRHTNDHMTSFYMFTPSGFLIEYGWGGRDIDVQGWRAEKMDCGPSLWGHDRTWLDESTRREAAAMRRAGARQGLKASVAVTPGHFVETTGDGE
jgi:2,3-dihydroxybiphenyl 1,2-dioxygenase